MTFLVKNVAETFSCPYQICFIFLLACGKTYFPAFPAVSLSTITDQWNVGLCVCDSATPWTVAHRAPLSMGFSRQEYWSGFLFPSPECRYILLLGLTSKCLINPPYFLFPHPPLGGSQGCLDTKAEQWGP